RADALRGVRPRPVIDELAHAVRLDVRGRGADEALALPRGERRRPPAGPGADAARRLEAGEEGVLDEGRVVPREGVPYLPRHGGDAGERPHDQRGQGYSPTTRASCARLVFAISRMPASIMRRFATRVITDGAR